MVEHILSALASFAIWVISTGGYLGIMLLMAIESACIPLPSEIIMPFAGYLVSTGRFDLFLAATAGVTYTTQAGRSLTLDAQYGPERNGNSGLGVVASVSFPEVLGENSSLRVYTAYEPWRWNTNPLRAGVEVTRPVGPGTLKLDVRGGLTRDAQAGFGVAVGYSYPLGQSESQP